MKPSDYYSNWDQLVNKWFQDMKALEPFMDNARSLSLRHIPEPFYGDMDDCSIVIINLNPGAGLCEQCWFNQNQTGLFINDIKLNNYSGYAKSFPLLSSRGPLPSVNWWNKRYTWIKRILELNKHYCNKQIDDNKMPFAIELVPLHSQSFKVSNIVEYITNIGRSNNMIDTIGAIDYAIEHSDAKMGLAVGKPIYEVLLNNGYYPSIDTHPIQPDSSIKRYYSVLVKGESKILSTWSSGSNQPPADTFEVHEKEILKNFF